MWLSRLIRNTLRHHKPGPTKLPPESLAQSERLPELRGAPISFGPVRVLSYDPPVFLSGIPYDEFLGIARAFGKR